MKTMELGNIRAEGSKANGWKIFVKKGDGFYFDRMVTVKSSNISKIVKEYERVLLVESYNENE